MCTRHNPHNPHCATCLASEPRPSESIFDWRDWTGGEMPVPYGTLIDVEYRNGVGRVVTAGESGALTPYWLHVGGRSAGFEIVRYRLRNPPAAPAIGEADPTGRSAHTPGAKMDAGKSRVWLCVSGFSNALGAVADVTTKGAAKYAPNSWQQVPDGAERYMEGFARHALALGRGEVLDTGPGGTGCLHKAQMVWNLLASLELDLRAEEVAS